MPAPFLEDVQAWAEVNRRTFSNLVNELNELERNGDKYTAASRDALVSEIKAKLVNIAELTDGSLFAGDSRPEV